MSKPTFEELIAKVRLQLQDAEGNYWTDEEITDYLNEGQLEYCRKTKALRGEAPIVRKINNDTYALPEDCLEVLRIEDDDGNEIPRATSVDLQARRGEFRKRNRQGASDSTNVQFAYSDLDGQGGIRFYPRPASSMQENSVQFSTDRIDLSLRDGLDPLQVLSSKFAVGERYAAAIGISNLKMYSYKASFIAQNASTLAFVTPADSGAKHLGDASDGYVVNDSFVKPTFFKDANGDIQWIFLGGDEEATLRSNISNNLNGGNWVSWRAGSPTNFIDYVFPSDGDDTVVFVEYDSSSGWRIGTSPVLSFSATYTYTFAGSPSDNPFRGGNVARKPDGTGWYYFGTSARSGLSNGVVYEIGADGSFDETVSIFNEFSAVWQTAVTIGDKVWVKSNNGWFIFTGSEMRRTQISTNETPVGDDGKILYVDYFDLGVKRAVRRYDSESLQLIDEYEFASVSNDYQLVYLDGDVYDVGEDDTGGYLISWFDFGAISVIDSIEAQSDFGVVVDIESIDNEDIVVFSQEYGAVSEIVQSSVGFYVHYTKKPSNGACEINEPLALVHYALYKCYEKDGDQTAMQNSAMHELKFQRILRRDIERASDGFLGKPTRTKGYYF